MCIALLSLDPEPGSEHPKSTLLDGLPPEFQIAFANCLGDIASRYNGHINRMNANTKCLGLKTQSAQELLNEMVRRERDSISNSYILKWWESDPDSKREWGDASFEEAVSTFKKKRT